MTSKGEEAARSQGGVELRRKTADNEGRCVRANVQKAGSRQTTHRGRKTSGSTLSQKTSSAPNSRTARQPRAETVASARASRPCAVKLGIAPTVRKLPPTMTLGIPLPHAPVNSRAFNSCPGPRTAGGEAEQSHPPFFRLGRCEAEQNLFPAL
jgi:hypothetical protein